MIFVHRSMIGSTVSAVSGGNIGTTRATPISTRRFTRSRSSLRPNEVISIDAGSRPASLRSEEHTSELQSQSNLVCRLLLEKKKKKKKKKQQSTKNKNKQN